MIEHENIFYRRVQLFFKHKRTFRNPFFVANMKLLSIVALNCCGSLSWLESRDCTHLAIRIFFIMINEQKYQEEDGILINFHLINHHYLAFPCGKESSNLQPASLRILLIWTAKPHITLAL